MEEHIGILVFGAVFVDIKGLYTGLMEEMREKVSYPLSSWRPRVRG